MSNETTPQDSAAMPPASAGSQPVAWAVFDGHDRMHLAPGYSEAESCAEDIDGEIVPLYRKPTLTDEEREAIEWAEVAAIVDAANETDADDAVAYERRAATLRALRERLS